VLYDITRSYFEGAYTQSDLITFGYNRDGKLGHEQMVIALLGSGGLSGRSRPAAVSRDTECFYWGCFACFKVPDDQGMVHFRVFLDRSVLEVFAADRGCMTQRLYPTREDSLGVSFLIRKGSAIVHRLSAWKMVAVWPNQAQRSRVQCSPSIGI
jgi:hypothetical protein